MFKLVANPQFTHEVPIMVPVDGGYREEKFRARFQATGDTEGDSLIEIDNGRGLLRRVVVEVFDVVNEAGDPIPWSDELRETLLDLPYVRAGLARAYFGALSKARAGN